MTEAYSASEWHELYVMLGGAFAALAGLLFVAISIQIEVIRKAPQWRTRAYGNVVALTGLLVQAACILTPQEPAWLGIELLVANLCLLALVPLRAHRDLARLGGPMPRLRLLAGMAAWLAGAWGGASLIWGAGGGLYWIVASNLAIAWLAILNAWSFITVEADLPEADGS